MSSSKYWLISGPGMPTTDNTFKAVNDKTSAQADLSQNVKFQVPDLRVGTLDALMALSDDLVKFDTFVEQTTRRIGGQLHGLLGHTKKESENQSLSVNGLELDLYLRKFQWDSAKYPVKSSCRELAENIQKAVAKVDEEIRVKMSDYQALVQQVNAVERKKQGTLVVRDLSDLVNAEDVVNTEYLVTVFVVITKFSYKDWEESYERMAQYIVPRSSKLVVEDGDQGLFSVQLFRRCLDDFKNACREKRFTVREHELSADGMSGSENLKSLIEQKDKMKNSLLMWCKTNFAEVFIGWAHLKAIRVHVESILRFGLPANFQPILMQPHKKTSEQKLRTALNQIFAHLSSGFSDDGKGKDDDIAGIVQEKFYPYVYLEVDVEFNR